MKIAIGCDHAAFKEKNILIDFIENDLGHKVIDLGCHSSDSVDYPEYGHLVGKVNFYWDFSYKTAKLKNVTFSAITFEPVVKLKRAIP